MKSQINRLLCSLFAISLIGLVTTSEGQSATSPAVEQWGIFELSLEGPSTRNPFQEVSLAASFTQGDQTIEVAGLYDGDGIYRIRFMLEKTGIWQ